MNVMRLQIFPKLDVPNKNGRTYPRKVLEQAVMDVTYVEIRGSHPPGRPVCTTLGTASKFHIRDDGHVGALGTFLDSEVMEMVADGRLVPVLSGTGSITKEGVVKPNYQITGVILTNDPA